MLPALLWGAARRGGPHPKSRLANQAMFVAIAMRISYTARLQANCNPALSQTKKLIKPNVM
jgi:hypothetical protein